MLVIACMIIWVTFWCSIRDYMRYVVIVFQLKTQIFTCGNIVEHWTPIVDLHLLFTKHHGLSFLTFTSSPHLRQNACSLLKHSRWPSLLWNTNMRSWAHDQIPRLISPSETGLKLLESKISYRSLWNMFDSVLAYAVTLFRAQDSNKPQDKWWLTRTL